MSDDQRNSFDNLLLLCPNHHKLIDDLEPDRHTVEVLEEMKRLSELSGKAATPFPDDADCELLEPSLWRGFQREAICE